MMKELILQKDKINFGNLILVNAKYPLKKADVPDLVPVDLYFSKVLLKRDVAHVLELIMEKIGSGNKILPVSGYRSLEEQTCIYDNSIKENGIDFTKKYVALPNHSEHQTGLAIDLGLNKENIDFICPDFPYDGICKAFREVSQDYGFIERYSKDKEKITGISHEPWHFRYVGYPHSRIMKEKKISLEEYIEFIKNYDEKDKYVIKENFSTEIEIYYVSAKDFYTHIRIPKDCIYQISGNNVDGFIVTLWRKK